MDKAGGMNYLLALVYMEVRYHSQNNITIYRSDADLMFIYRHRYLSIVT